MKTNIKLHYSIPFPLTLLCLSGLAIKLRNLFMNKSTKGFVIKSRV